MPLHKNRRETRAHRVGATGEDLHDCCFEGILKTSGEGFSLKLFLIARHDRFVFRKYRNAPELTDHRVINRTVS